MKTISKWLILTYILAAIAVVECGIIIYDWLRPVKTNFVLATAEIDVPAREVKIPPQLFEMHSAQKIATELDEFLAEYKQKNNLIKIITAQYLPEEEMQTTEKAVASNGQKYIAVVIDDMGVSPQLTKQIIDLKKPLTASFLPYAPANMKQVELAKKSGFEVMLHIPMMPHQRMALAPVTLAPEMNKEELQKHMRDFLAYYEGAEMHGTNNHMGSEFTENSQSMAYVMEILKENGMFFLDSKTTGKSAGKQTAQQLGVPYIARDVFLDNENDYDYIMAQLHQAEKIATKYGYAVAIGHPHSQTVRALGDWLKDVENRGFVLVHISDLLNLQPNK